MVMKISACAIEGIACPRFRVPGMASSGIKRRARIAAVVGAKEPMPSVSKKLVTKPSSSSNCDGGRRAYGGGVRRAWRHQAAASASAVAARATSSRVRIAFTAFPSV